MRELGIEDITCEGLGIEDITCEGVGDRGYYM